MAFEPQNSLEKSLVKAAADPAHRPQFYKDLVNADIFIVQHSHQPPEKEGRVTLDKGTLIQISNVQHNGKSYIPIFSSVLRLQITLSGNLYSERRNADSSRSA